MGDDDLCHRPSVNGNLLDQPERDQPDDAAVLHQRKRRVVLLEDVLVEELGHADVSAGTVPGWRDITSATLSKLIVVPTRVCSSSLPAARVRNHPSTAGHRAVGASVATNCHQLRGKASSPGIEP